MGQVMQHVIQSRISWEGSWSKIVLVLVLVPVQVRPEALLQDMFQFGFWFISVRCQFSHFCQTLNLWWLGHVATPPHGCCHNMAFNISFCHWEVFARGSTIIHDLHSCSAMIPAAILTTGSVKALAPCLSLLCQLPHPIVSIIWRDWKMLLHYRETSTKLISDPLTGTTHGCLYSRAKSFSVFRLGATGSASLLILKPSSGLYFTLVSSVPSAVFSHFSTSTGEFFFCWNKQCEHSKLHQGSQGPFVNVFAMMSYQLLTLNERFRKETRRDAICHYWNDLVAFSAQ